MTEYTPVLQDDGKEDLQTPGPQISGAKSKSREPDWVSTSDPFIVVDHGDPMDLDEDVYGAAIFTLTYDSFELLTGKDHDGLSFALNIYRMAVVLVLLGANYLLQFALLFWILIFVAIPAQHDVQRIYQEFHVVAFSKGHFDQDRWDDWGAVKHDELCSIAFVSFDFMYAVLCVWWVHMVMELRKTERTMRKFRTLRSCKNAENMVIRGNDVNMVVKLTPLVRGLLWFALLIPKFLIAGTLTVVGTVWLTATDSYSELILNSLALTFVVKIDEILFAGLLPESIKTDIAQTKLLIPNVRQSLNDKFLDAAQDEKKVIAGYKRSTLYLLIVVSAVMLFMTYGQDIPYMGVFPGHHRVLSGRYVDDIKEACPTWFRRSSAQVCSFGKNCFPIF